MLEDVLADPSALYKLHRFSRSPGFQLFIYFCIAAVTVTSGLETSRALAGCRGKNAAPDATKRAYRKLILRFHPDRFSRFTLHERDRDKIMAKCVAVSAAIQTQYAEATRDSRVASRA